MLVPSFSVQEFISEGMHEPLAKYGSGVNKKHRPVKLL